METKVPVLFMLAIAVGGAMWAGSGIADELVENPAEDLSSPEHLEDRRNQSGVTSNESGGFDGPINPTEDESTLVGLIVSASRAVVDIFGFVVLLPLELVNLGFPRWFSYPLGFAVQLLAGVGLVQFATGRVFR